MGNTSQKAMPDEHTGLTSSQVNLVQKTWLAYCSGHRDYSRQLFLALFARHPDYLALFPFSIKPVASLADDPVFRTHATATGDHLTSPFDSSNEPEMFEVLACGNAAEHVKRKRVKPDHFQVMGDIVVNVLKAEVHRQLKPASVEAR
ncbi:uncharacterized protein LOC144146468 [Haemaphysalis longicornis]